ncbi:protein of unknown function [Taphrina deformans PYCC 5710]|uniref:Uncharacterized protein n=1 Tax=Taphrina deformans (strain PYCC 5710 / ATCC 11124 / CBS 356.35 / IMI 108563 / JCM 9778 / NBRC 8474) TaxID=1097556 RepID=R4XEV5_TAPDE|nr:protein of unknown function [Taphrina deformans PYCC 5710]|eukprot:CCG81902.1 protein of unknown function [Taphrina deformans PYCC 5710]
MRTSASTAGKSQQNSNTNGSTLQKEPHSVVASSTVKVYQANIFQSVRKTDRLEKLKSTQASVQDNQKQIQEVVRISDSSTHYIETQLRGFVSKFLQEVPAVAKLPSKLRCGTAYPSATYLSSIVVALSNLLKRSITEDTFGRVHKDVVQILLKFSELHDLIQSSCHQAEGTELSISQLSTAYALVSNIEAAISSVGALFSHFVDLPPELGKFAGSHGWH